MRIGFFTCKLNSVRYIRRHYEGEMTVGHQNNCRSCNLLDEPSGTVVSYLLSPRPGCAMPIPTYRLACQNETFQNENTSYRFGSIKFVCQAVSTREATSHQLLLLGKQQVLDLGTALQPPRLEIHLVAILVVRKRHRRFNVFVDEQILFASDPD